MSVSGSAEHEDAAGHRRLRGGPHSISDGSRYSGGHGLGFTPRVCCRHGRGDPRAYAQMKQSSRTLLDEQAEKMRDAGAKITKKHLRNGRPGQEIVSLAEELGAGLIVMGGRGLGGMKRALMGSVSDSVVRHAHCPVLVARGSHV